MCKTASNNIGIGKSKLLLFQFYSKRIYVLFIIMWLLLSSKKIMLDLK